MRILGVDFPFFPEIKYRRPNEATVFLILL